MLAGERGTSSTGTAMRRPVVGATAVVRVRVPAVRAPREPAADLGPTGGATTCCTAPAPTTGRTAGASAAVVVGDGCSAGDCATGGATTGSRTAGTIVAVSRDVGGAGASWVARFISRTATAPITPTSNTAPPSTHSAVRRARCVGGTVVTRGGPVSGPGGDAYCETYGAPDGGACTGAYIDGGVTDALTPATGGDEGTNPPLGDDGTASDITLHRRAASQNASIVWKRYMRSKATAPRTSAPRSDGIVGQYVSIGVGCPWMTFARMMLPVVPS